jgi:phospholipid/cholesterol/gamma-HCH transport system substrate-binding protein
MNNKVNYTFVGILVLIGFALLFAFTYWMLKPSSDAETQRYLIYFDESVFGLNLDAPVKFRGITVGKVVDLRINKKNSEQVQVTVEIFKDTPINESTVAKLTAQGITGLTYINLTQRKHDAPPLKRKKTEKYPVIKSVPSFFENFEHTLGDMTTELTKTLKKTQKLLDEKNQEEMTRLLTQSANVMQKIDKMLDEQTIAHVHSSVKNIDAITYKVDKIVPNIDAFVAKSIIWEKGINDSFESIKQTYLRMDKKMKDMANTFEEAKVSFETMTRELDATMKESQYLMIDMQDSIESLEASPSDVLYKKRQEHKAPGEEK